MDASSHDSAAAFLILVSCVLLVFHPPGGYINCCRQGITIKNGSLDKWKEARHRSGEERESWLQREEGRRMRLQQRRRSERVTELLRVQSTKQKRVFDGWAEELRKSSSSRVAKAELKQVNPVSGALQVKPIKSLEGTGNHRQSEKQFSAHVESDRIPDRGGQDS